MMIRPAIEADAPAIAAIWNESIRDSVITFTDVEKTAADLRQLMADGQVFLIAEHGGTVVGFATYGSFRKGSGYRHTAELSIYLMQHMQGQGVGKDLMDALQDRARRQDIHVLVAGVSAANRPAIDFHLAMGFSEVARMPEVGRKGGRWLDLVLLQKLLNT